MTSYDHYQFGLEMAMTLRSVLHSSSTPRYFTAAGSETLASFEDRLSQVDGAVMIAVDAVDEDCFVRGADQLEERALYVLVLAFQALDGVASAIETAQTNARRDLRQVRNVLLSRYGTRVQDISLSSIGPFGDNMYGAALEYRMSMYPSFSVDQTLFQQTSST